LDFTLAGDRLQGGWKLVRTSMRGRQRQWLLIKRDDAYAADLEADDMVDEGRATATAEQTATRKSAAKKSAARKATQKSSAEKSVKRSQSSATWHKRALALDGARDDAMP